MQIHYTMKNRALTWSSLGAPSTNGDANNDFEQSYSRGAFVLSHSDDGWLRLRISLHSHTAERRSWALDPEREATRCWSPLTPPPSTERPRVAATQVVGFVDGDIEGKSNPHADTRGLINERLSATTCSIPLQASGNEYRAGLPVDLARCEDGLRIDLPLEAAMQVYGLGEKTGGLDKRGRTWAFWNTDEPLHIPTRDPLYQSIPIAYLHTPRGTLTVFSDSPSQQYFDVAESNQDRLRIEAYDAQVDIYLRWDETLPDAVCAYSGLTGVAPLPPLWALGFQQCRYSYLDEARVLEVAERMRRERVPCDVLYLDIHYMDGYRVFTWNPQRFPEPRRMLDDLHQQGYRVVSIIDPGVKADPDYPVYLEGIQEGVFLQRRDCTPYIGRVWPGDAAFPDFTRQRTRHWWARHQTGMLATGVDGIWNDMNEPSDFSGDTDYRPLFTVPDDLIAANDGHPVSFGRLHNVFANGMNQATRHAFAMQAADKRGFVLTRAGYAGIQRHATVWTGDNHSWWEHLALMIPMHLNLSLSGVPFCGADTGGFQLNASPELFTRWFAAACLMPFFRAHSALDTLDHEPWSFGSRTLDTVRRFIELRYQLLPYLYTLLETACDDGTPLIRPLLWDWPDDPRVVNRSDSFMLGNALLVAPVRESGIQERSVYLPSGNWYDFWNGAMHTGPTSIVADAPLERLPLFMRAGTIIPFESIRQHTGEPGDAILRLLVAPSAAESAPARAMGTLYADAGEGHDYQSGAYWRAELKLDATRVSAVTIAGAGPAVSRWTHMAVFRVGQALTEAPHNPVQLDILGGLSELH